MRYSAIMLLLIIYSLLLTSTTGFHTPTSSNLYNIKGIKHTQTSRINTELNSSPVVEFLSHFNFDQFIQNGQLVSCSDGDDDDAYYYLDVFVWWLR